MRLALRLLTVLSALVLLTGVFGRASVAWACEGRVCSSDAERCCCASPSGARDGSCRLAPSGRDGACKGRCACRAVVLKAAPAATFETSKAVHITVLADAATAVLPEPVRSAHSYVLLETPQVRAIPPPDGLPDPPRVEHASPRAPPATA